ncbi:alpha/beta fold hydrolase [Bounagaea algeriensis]
MHYVESGVGRPLVLLHAFPIDSRMWNGARARLEQQARVITPDQRGMGQSPLVDARTPDTSADDPGLPTVAADVLALLDDLGLDRVMLGGCSMGGYAAMAVLRAAPERVNGLLLVDTKAAADAEQARANRLSVAERAESEGVDGWLAGDMLPNLLGTTTHETRSAVVERARAIIDSQAGAGVAWAQRAMAARPDNTELLRSYTGPVLVVSGAEDAITPPEDAAALAEQLPSGEFHSVPGTGHLSPLEDPDGFADIVGPWLRRIG